MLSFSKWPDQNSSRIQYDIRKILKRQGIHRASDNLYNAASRCNFICNKDAPFERTLPQKVVQSIVTPASRYNLLARHDVGTGKSCVGLSVAYNFASNGQNVLWVSRKGLAHETILKRPDCFDAIDRMTRTVEEKQVALGKNSHILWGNPKMEIQVLSYINLANLIKDKKSKTDKERLDALGMIEPDIFRDCLLIIDEPHLMYTEGSLGAEGRKALWQELGNAIDRSYRISGDNSVTVLLLTATPLTNELDDAAKLINLLIRDPKRKLPIGKPLSDLLLKEPERIGELMRGYISYHDGSGDISRFAQVEPFQINAKVALNENRNSLTQSVMSGPSPRSKSKKRKVGGNARKVKLDYNYHEQLQIDCAQGSLEPRKEKAEKQKLLNCYFERSDLVGSPWLDKEWRDFNLIQKSEDNVPASIMKKRMSFIEFCRNRAPKALALYEKIQELDAKDDTKKKHFIFSGSPKTTSSVGVLASLFAAHGHRKLNFVDDTEIVDGKTVKALKFQKSYGNQDAYIVMGKSPTLYADQGSFNVHFKSTTFGTHRQELFNFINKRPDNTHGEEVRFIILDYSLKEGVDLKDIGYIHLLEKQRTKAEETQAMGRALRMCGNCGLSYNKGWKIQAYTYDVVADRLPLIAPQYEGEEKPEGFSKEEFKDYIAKYKDNENQEDIVLEGYGDYVREASTDPNKQLAFERFDEQMRLNAIDFGFYDLFDEKKLRIAIAIDSLSTIPDEVPINDKGDMQSLIYTLQGFMNTKNENKVPILSDTAIAPGVYDYIIQSWAAPIPNYLGSKANRGVFPSFRALQLFSSKCHYYLWLISKGFHVLPYKCVKKLNKKVILKAMGPKSPVLSINLQNELDKQFGKAIFREPSIQPKTPSPLKLQRELDLGFANPKFRRNSVEALQEKLNRSFAKPIFKERPERRLVAKPASNNVFVPAQILGEFDPKITTAFDELFKQKEQVVLQPFIEDVQSISVWVVGKGLKGMETIMTTNDKLYKQGESRIKNPKEKKKKKLELGSDEYEKGELEDLCERIMEEMQKEVGPIWCAKIHLLSDGYIWYVDKITLRMDMRDWPKDKPFKYAAAYYTSLMRLTKPKVKK